MNKKTSPVDILLGKQQVPAGQLRAEDWGLLVRNIVTEIRPILKRMPDFVPLSAILNRSMPSYYPWERVASHDLIVGIQKPFDLRTKCRIIYTFVDRFYGDEVVPFHQRHRTMAGLIITPHGEWGILIFRSSFSASLGNLHEILRKFRVVALDDELLSKILGKNWPWTGQIGQEVVTQLGYWCEHVVKKREEYLDDAKAKNVFLQGVVARFGEA